MDAIEKRARAIFAKWHEDKGCGPRVVRDCRNGTIQMDALTSELLRMALTPPEGYVLVPVESVKRCACGCERYCCTHCGTELGGLAARPEVPNG